MSVEEQLTALMEEFTKLQTDKKKLKETVERLKETIERQGKACLERHELLCEVKGVVDRYFEQQKGGEDADKD